MRDNQDLLNLTDDIVETFKKDKMKTKTIYRSAKTGKIVTAKFAKENPETTVKETMKVVPKKAIETLRKYQEWR